MYTFPLHTIHCFNSMMLASQLEHSSFYKGRQDKKYTKTVIDCMTEATLFLTFITNLGDHKKHFYSDMGGLFRFISQWAID